jgi:hypothetical protein
VICQTADQVAIALLGVIIAAGCCCSPGCSCGSARRGVAVRNLFGDRLVPWSDVVA